MNTESIWLVEVKSGVDGMKGVCAFSKVEDAESYISHSVWPEDYAIREILFNPFCKDTPYD